MVITLLGIVTDVSDVHPPKALLPNDRVRVMMMIVIILISGV